MARKKKSHSARGTANVPRQAASVVLQTMVPHERPSPFVGPRPFKVGDENRFFGRDREASQLVSLIASNQYVLLYAQSGAGKTSLLHAKITPQLQKQGFDVLVGRVRSTFDINVPENANPFVVSALASWLDWHPNSQETSSPPIAWWTSRPSKAQTTRTLAEFLRGRPATERRGFKPCVLVFDQFEELFTHNPGLWTFRKGFFQQVRDAVEGSPDLIDFESLLDPDKIVSRLCSPRDPLSKYLTTDNAGELPELLKQWRSKVGGRSNQLSKLREEILLDPGHLKVPTAKKQAYELLRAVIRRLNAAIQDFGILEKNVRGDHRASSIAESEEFADGTLLETLPEIEDVRAIRLNRRFVEESYPGCIARSVDGDPNVRVVFSIREDFLGSFTPYVRLFSDRLRTRFRLERLRRPAAIEAVTGPLIPTGVGIADSTAEKLVEDLMRAEGGSDAEQAAGPDEFVEPVQLQIVCENIWERLGSETAITEQHLAGAGSVAEALEAFYDRCMSRATSNETLPGTISNRAQKKRTGNEPREEPVTEGVVRRWCEEKLITTAQTRAVVFQDKHSTGGLPNSVVKRLDEMYLIKPEVRGGRQWYELSHDRLITPIRNSNEKWFSGRAASRSFRQHLEASAKKWQELQAQQGETTVLGRVLLFIIDLFLIRKVPEGLLSGSELARAREWLNSDEAREIPPSSSVRELIRSSSEANEHYRTILMRYAATAAILFVLFLLAMVMRQSQLRRNAEFAKLIERGNTAKFLATQPGKEFDALILGIRAVEDRPFEMEPPPEAIEGLRAAVTAIGTAKWLRGGSGYIEHLEFSLDNKFALLLAGGEVTLWDATSGAFRRVIRPSNPPPRSGPPNRNPTSLPSTMAEVGSFSSPDVPSPASQSPFINFVPRGFESAMFGGDGEWIVTKTFQSPQSEAATVQDASASGSPIQFWNTATGDEIRIELESGETLRGITGDRNWVIISGNKDHIRLVDPTPESPAETLQLDGVKDVDRIDVSPSKKRALIISSSAHTLWDLTEMTPLEELKLTKKERDDYRSVQFTKSGARFLLWSGQGEQTWSLNWLKNPPPSPGNDFPASTTSAAPPSVWNTETAERIVTLENALGPALFLATDGRRVVTYTIRSAEVFSTDNGESIARRYLPSTQPLYAGPETMVVFDGVAIVPVTNDGTNGAVIWDGFSGKTLGYFEGLPDASDSATRHTLSSDKRSLLVGRGARAWLLRLDEEPFDFPNASWRELLQRGYAQLQLQPECLTASVDCTCLDVYPTPAVDDGTQKQLIGPTVRDQVPPQAFETPDELPALKAMKNDAAYASRFLSRRLGLSYESIDVLLLPSHDKSVYWHPSARAIFAPPEVQHLPDLIYMQVAHAYLGRITRLGDMRGQSAALRISLAEVLTILIKQSKPQRNKADDWVIAPGEVAWLMGEAISPEANRQAFVSFANIGKSPSERLPFGRMPQVAHIQNFTNDLDQGMYVNCGIPNKVFYDVAQEIGTEKAAEIWIAMIPQLPDFATFEDAARVSIDIAKKKFSPISGQSAVVEKAWKSVGVEVGKHPE